MNQAFTIYFFRDQNPQSENNGANGQEEEEEKKSYQQSIGIMSEIPRGEYEVLMERIENDLVAFGEFQASEIVQNSICQDDFIDVEPRLTQNSSTSTGPGISKQNTA